MTTPAALESPVVGTDAPATGRLYRDAAALVTSSLVSAGTGIVFWIAAARLLSPERLGVQTALLSPPSRPRPLIIAAGVGDALNAMIPAHRHLAREMVRSGYRLAFVYGLPVALAAAIASTTVLPSVRGRWPPASRSRAGS